LPIEQTDARYQNSQTDTAGAKAMTHEYGILLFILGIIVTVGFFGILFWAMDDRPKPKTALDEDNPVVQFNKRYNSVDKS
jgi:hypothetical protein